MLSEQEMEKRRLAVQNALANQRLEGLEPDPEIVAEVEQGYVSGEISLAGIIDRYRQKVRRDQQGG